MTLEERAKQHYQKKLQSKALKVSSLTFVGLSLCLLTAVFLGLLNIWTILASLVIAAATCFGVILRIFPTKADYESRFALMLRAVEDPAVIEHSALNKVKLKDKQKVVTLEPIFLDVWTAVIAPYLFTNHSNTLKEIRSNSEKLKRENLEKKSAVEAQIAELRAQKNELNNRMKKLQSRENQIQSAESSIINRFAELEKTQRDLQTMKAELEHSSSQASESKERLQKLAEKEAAIAEMEAQLAEDRAIVATQKSELNQLKGELLASAEPGNQSSVDDSDLKKKIAELESAQADLEERSAYIETVENQLIEQLHALTEREAMLEQKEINAGVRSD